MALNQQLQEAAKILADGIGTTGAARTSLGGGGTAFGWVDGLVPTVASYATTAVADGMSYKATIVSESASTPATVVAAGGLKPTATTLTPSTQPLVKFAGMGVFNLEDSLDASGLAAAMANVIGNSCLKAFEAHAVTKLSAGAGSTVTGTDWVEAVANAQAAVLANGAKPSVLVISAANYGAFVADVVAVNAFSQSPDSPVGALLGTPVHVSPSAPAGNAYVFDSSSVLAVQHAASPLFVLDAYTLSDKNQARLVVDLVAACFVASGKGLVKITAPVATAAAAARTAAKK